MTRLNDGERLVKVETQLTQVLQGITEIKSDNKEFRDRLDLLLPTFATHEDLTQSKAELLKEINEIKASRWVQNTLSAILGSVLTLLIGYALANIFK